MDPPHLVDFGDFVEMLREEGGGGETPEHEHGGGGPEEQDLDFDFLEAGGACGRSLLFM